MKIYRPTQPQRNLGKAFPKEIYSRPQSRWIERHIFSLALLMLPIAFALAAIQFASLREIGFLLRQAQDLAGKQQAARDQGILDYAKNCSLIDIECPGEQKSPVRLPESQPRASGVASWLVYQLPDTCAIRDFPRGSTLIVSNGATSITCRVRDWGPTRTDRIIDLSLQQFTQLQNPRHGLVNVTITEQ